MDVVYQKLQLLQERIRPALRAPGPLPRLPVGFLEKIKTIGSSSALSYFERRKLGIFNLLNFFQLLVGLTIPLLGALHQDALPLKAWLIVCLPALTSLLVLALNHRQKFDEALLAYFILYPFFTCIVYLNSINAGIGLHFILYGILSVFFLRDIGYMIFSVALSMVSYFILTVVVKHFIYQVETENKIIYLLNQAIAIAFIFCGLFLIKKENAEYQQRLLRKNGILRKKNLEIEAQKELLNEKALLLQSQKGELTELNLLKNRLFSVIAHDLKSPLYALRTLFQNVERYDIPATEIKEMVPEVVSDLNYTVGLMENLLQWAKTQMQADVVKVQEVDLTGLIGEVLKLLRLQAEAKQLRIESRAQQPVMVYADKDMINLVLRNLLSNAIKFTPPKGQISIGVNNLSSFAEVYVQDSGMGITEEAMKKINENCFYTTKGTASESGTGLGLMLCREFLARNGGQMHIESTPGQGSVFSFTLPLS
jgi:two-component system sensor histidine kinase/response regulator